MLLIEKKKQKRVAVLQLYIKLYNLSISSRIILAARALYIMIRMDVDRLYKLESFIHDSLNNCTKLLLFENKTMTQTNKKRKWEEFFMGNAFLAAKRSKNSKTQLGACIISEENYTVGVGYNNMTKGMEYLDGSNIKDSNLYECHAVLNAILNKNKAELNNCKIYVNSFPCNKCIKYILQSGINEIVYAKDGTGINPVSKKMLDEANIKYRHWHSMSEDNKIVLSCRKMDL